MLLSSPVAPVRPKVGMPKRPEQKDDDDNGDDDDKPRKFCLQSMLIMFHQDGSFNISLSIQDVDVHFYIIRNGCFLQISYLHYAPSEQLLPPKDTKGGK